MQSICLLMWINCVAKMLVDRIFSLLLDWLWSRMWPWLEFDRKPICLFNYWNLFKPFSPYVCYSRIIGTFFYSYSHDCIIAVQLFKDLSAFERDSGGDILMSVIACPPKERFIDCCVINHNAINRTFEVVCLTEPLSRFISWIVKLSDNSSLQWSQVCF